MMFVSIALLVSAAATAAPPALHWMKIPILSVEQVAAGIKEGGEGAQWPRGPVVVSPADPDFLLLPIDVGGLYRSLDGGKRWESAMVGWNARGANNFAIDPNDARRVLGVGANSMTWNSAWGKSPMGLYLSTDKAASWRQIHPANSGFGGQIAYDPTSFAPALGHCARAYFLEDGSKLMRSDDGGETWNKISDAPDLGFHDLDWTQGGGLDARMRLDPRNGAIYVGGVNGLWRSDDRGATWTPLRKEGVYSIAVTADGNLYVTGPEKLSLSKDGGKTFQVLPCAGIDDKGGQPVRNISVSPVDPQRMSLWVAGKNFQWPRYVSHDGGARWVEVKLDNHAALPQNARQHYSTWSPKDANVAWSIGGDWVMKSTDGGYNYAWSNSGYNGIMSGGTFNFNPFHPNLVYLGFQDYNGAFTTDGGKTWNYRDISGKGWGGHQYGAYALNAQVMWSGDSDSWYTPRKLRLTRDGGKTWNYVNGPDDKALEYKGAETSLGDPTDPNIAFAGSLRTTDGGLTWNRMTGCDGVYVVGSKTRTLYGKSGESAVSSKDHGVTWTKVIDVPGGYMDMAVDEEHLVLYFASQDRLKVFRNGALNTMDTPADQYGNQRVWTVATDPKDPAVLYVGAPRNTYACRATICRSTDGGATWTNLTVNTPLGNGIVDGPHETSMIRVNPVNREAWISGQCFGMWRIAAPAPGERGLPVAQAGAPSAK